MRMFRTPNGRTWVARGSAHRPPDTGTFEDVKDRLRMTYVGPAVDTVYAQQYDLYKTKYRGMWEYFMHDVRSIEGVFYEVGMT